MEEIEVDRKVITEIVRKHVHSAYPHLVVKDNQFFNRTLNGQIAFGVLDRDTIFSKILRQAMRDRKRRRRVYYHFKSPERIIDVLRSGSLRMYHLPAHSENDRLEFFEFLYRVGLLNSNNQFIDPPQIDVPIMPIEEVRKYLFILCFTRALNRKKFWNNYAANGTGAALVLDIYNIGEDEFEREFYHFRDVAYDNSAGDRFNFILAMQSELKRTVGVPVMLSRIPVLAAHFKRHAYRWEQETRLTFDLQYNVAGYGTVSSIGQTFEEDERGSFYIDVPIGPQAFNSNEEFRVRLRGLVLGPHSDAHAEEMRELISRKFSECFITDSLAEAKSLIGGLQFPPHIDETDEYFRMLLQPD